MSIRLGGTGFCKLKSTLLLIYSPTNNIATVLELKSMIAVSAPPQIIYDMYGFNHRAGMSSNPIYISYLQLTHDH